MYFTVTYLHVPSTVFSVSMVTWISLGARTHCHRTGPYRHTDTCDCMYLDFLYFNDIFACKAPSAVATCNWQNYLDDYGLNGQTTRFSGKYHESMENDICNPNLKLLQTQFANNQKTVNNCTKILPLLLNLIPALTCIIHQAFAETIFTCCSLTNKYYHIILFQLVIHDLCMIKSKHFLSSQR